MKRFWDKVKITSPHGCWEWTAYKDKYGYGEFWLNGKTKRAHGVAYELFNGPIPEGLEPDHLCRNPGCVNPLHLEAVTHKENLRRGSGRGGVLHTYTPKTHCLRGHERTPENVDSSGSCKTCRAECYKEYRNTHKEESAEYHRIYREKNKEKVAASSKRHREANREEINAKQKARYKENREKIHS